MGQRGTSPQSNFRGCSLYLFICLFSSLFLIDLGGLIRERSEITPGGTRRTRCDAELQIWVSSVQDQLPYIPTGLPSKGGLGGGSPNLRLEGDTYLGTHFPQAC